MLDPPDTRYALGPSGNIAYQIIGNGPIDLVVVPGWFSHIDMQWEDLCGGHISGNSRRLRA